MNSITVSAIGRYYVVCQLIRHGWPIDLTFNKSQNLGILIKGICADKFKIEVRTARYVKGSHGWHMKPHHETAISDNLFYALIDIGEQPSSPIVPYILPSKVVADCIRKTHQVWLDTPGRGGKPHNKKDMRMLMPDYTYVKPITEQGKAVIEEYKEGWLRPYRENWGILGLPKVA